MYTKFTQDRIVQLRMQKGVSAHEMSLDLGENGSYINRIENKQAFPSMQAFFYICEYLQISPRDFFDMDNPAPLKIKQIMEESQKLDDVQLDTVMAVVKGLQHRPK